MGYLFGWCIYASFNWVIIGSDKSLSPVRRLTTIWTIPDVLSVRPWVTYFNEILFEIQNFFIQDAFEMSEKNIGHFVSAIMS